MILVDTSIWIDHLHARESQLVELLERDEVGIHPVVIEELAAGSIADRPRVLELLSSLRRFTTISHDELLALIEQRRLWGRGLSVADIHLVGSVAVTPGGQLWTRDRRLRQVGDELGLRLVDE